MTDGIRKIAEHDGYDVCTRQLIEEMAELTKALNKHWRCSNDLIVADLDDLKDNIIEEITDVQICIDYIKHLLNIDEGSIDTMRIYKVNREYNKRFTNK